MRIYRVCEGMHACTNLRKYLSTKRIAQLMQPLSVSALSDSAGLQVNLDYVLALCDCMLCLFSSTNVCKLSNLMCHSVEEEIQQLWRCSTSGYIETIWGGDVTVFIQS